MKIDLLWVIVGLVAIYYYGRQAALNDVISNQSKLNKDFTVPMGGFLGAGTTEAAAAAAAGGITDAATLLGLEKKISCPPGTFASIGKGQQICRTV